MFQTRLKELRESAGYKSQQSFADAFGVAQSTVGGWESGKREPNYDTTIRLSKFFNVTVDSLIASEIPLPSPYDALPDADRRLLAAYATADEGMRGAVRKLLDLR